ncbi:MAG: cell wall-binding repeat-containing protein [Tessaracoccus sp.]
MFLKKAAAPLAVGLPLVLGGALLAPPAHADTSPPAESSPPEVKRIAGQTRYETAAEISKAWDPADVDYVFIATGQAFPDALAAGSIAGSYGQPLLLAKQDEIPPATQEALERLDPETIVLVGGPAAISEQVETQLEEIAKVEREFGATRYETAIELSKGAFDRSFDGLGTVLVADGRDFPDALSAGSLYAGTFGPLLLSGPEGLDDAALDEIERITPDFARILGGEAAVPGNVEGQLEDIDILPVRTGGVDRWETSLMLASLDYPVEEDEIEAVYFVTGHNYPDGLAVGPLASTQYGPVLLSHDACVTPDIADYVTALAPKNIYLVGGTGAVPDSVGELKVCS